MPRFRFSLAFLLALTTLVAAFFGYANYRRVFLQREAEALAAVGVVLTQGKDIPYEPTGFWPQRPRKARFAFYVLQPEHIQTVARRFTVAEAQEHYRDLERRFRAMGIEECSVTMAHYCAQGGGRELISADDLQRYAAAGAFWDEPNHASGGCPQSPPSGAAH